jgi:Clusterin-associated protein-1
MTTSAYLQYRYDPETTISDRIETETERIEFLTGIANLMASKARLKLNTKKLYASDGRAVQELLKLATLLYKCVICAVWCFHYMQTTSRVLGPFFFLSFSPYLQSNNIREQKRSRQGKLTRHQSPGGARSAAAGI